MDPVGLTGPRLTKPFLSATRSAVCRSAGCRILTRNVLVKISAVVVPVRTRSPITASSSIVTRGGRRGKSRYSYSAFAGSGILDARGTRLLEVRDGTTTFVVVVAVVKAAKVVEAATVVAVGSQTHGADDEGSTWEKEGGKEGG